MKDQTNSKIIAIMVIEMGLTGIIVMEKVVQGIAEISQMMIQIIFLIKILLTEIIEVKILLVLKRKLIEENFKLIMAQKIKKL